MDVPPAPPPPSPFQLPIFRAVWFASLSSNFGGLIQSVGASWMMTSLTHSPQMIALVQASTTLPFMLFALLAGAVADNLDRRKVMLAAQLFMLAVSAMLAIGAWTGIMTPWLLLLSTFLIACGTTFNGSAWQASVGDIVPRAALPGAVALNSMGFNIARSVGPAVGGAIVAAAGAAAAFATNALSYVALICVLARWKPALPPRRLPRERLDMAMGAGVRYVAMSPPIRVVLVRAALFGIAASALSALMPLVARDIVAGGPLIYGVLLGAFGIGAVGGALASGWLRRHRSIEWIVRTASIGLALGTAAVAASGSLPLTIVALMPAGACWVLALSTFNVSVQLASPRWVVARALAHYQMAAFGGMAIGSWAFGALADRHGAAGALYAAAATLLIGTLIGMRWPMPDTSTLNLDPQGRWREPETAIPVEPRSGPIVITIEHRIPAGNVAAFLAAMSERRRIRRRDGARHWTLLRDLAEPALWVERYHLPTWLDYVRHNERRTLADQANSDLIQTLRAPGIDPVIHRMIERQTGSLPQSRSADPGEIEPMTDPTRSN